MGKEMAVSIATAQTWDQVEARLAIRYVTHKRAVFCRNCTGGRGALANQSEIKCVDVILKYQFACGISG